MSPSSATPSSTCFLVRCHLRVFDIEVGSPCCGRRLISIACCGRGPCSLQRAAYRLQWVFCPRHSPRESSYTWHLANAVTEVDQAVYAAFGLRFTNVFLPSTLKWVMPGQVACEQRLFTIMTMPSSACAAYTTPLPWCFQKLLMAVWYT